MSFVAAGASLTPTPGRIVFDTGNRLCNGIIDHHQAGAGFECSTSLVIRRPELVVDHVGNLPLEDIEFVTHRHPDLDAVTAIFCAWYMLSHSKLPPHAESLAQYLIDIDQGICLRFPDHFITVYSLFIEMTRQLERSGTDNADIQRIVSGFELWNYVFERMVHDTNLHRSDLFAPPHPFTEAQQSIIDDKQRYRIDRQRGHVTKFWLPRKDDRPPEPVDGMTIADPESMLFKSWARLDPDTPSGQRGFTLLAVNSGHRRYIISVDPLKSFCLKGLGDMLETAETRKRLDIGRERKGLPRKGYKGPDPWYDGRNELHQSTIIDTPYGGTVLTWSEIKTLIVKFSESLRFP